MARRRQLAAKLRDQCNQFIGCDKRQSSAATAGTTNTASSSNGVATGDSTQPVAARLSNRPRPATQPPHCLWPLLAHDGTIFTCRKQRRAPIRRRTAKQPRASTATRRVRSFLDAECIHCCGPGDAVGRSLHSAAADEIQFSGKLWNRRDNRQSRRLHWRPRPLKSPLRSVRRRRMRSAHAPRKDSGDQAASSIESVTAKTEAATPTATSGPAPPNTFNWPQNITAPATGANLPQRRNDRHRSHPFPSAGYECISSGQR